MKKLASILIIAFAFSLGGEQLLLTLGRFYAHSHAIKMSSYVNENSEKLFEQTLSLSTYQNIDFEYVGNDVFEYESNGKMYDVFKVKFSEDQAILLVKEDKLETGIVVFQKLLKRKLRTTSERIKNQVFNFYFFQNAQEIIISKTFSAFRFSVENSTPRVLNLLLDCPPPESL